MLNLIFCSLLCFFSAHVKAETIHIEKNFEHKETVEITTGDQKTQDHELFEYYVYSLFETVPYLQVTPTYYEAFAGKTIDTFLPDFAQMEILGHNYMIYYTITKNDNNTLLSYVVFDALYQNALISGSYNTNLGLKKIAANISHTIYNTITGEFGFFVGTLFYTERSAKSGYQVIYSQGLNFEKTQYTNEKSMITSPSYCNNGKQVFFANSNGDGMSIYHINTKQPKAKQVEIPTTNNPYLLSPEISQDCNTLFVSSMRENGSDILMYNLQNRKLTTIVSDEHINTRPIFNKEITQVYYISNKLSPTKIWARTLDGSNVSYLVSRGLGGYIYIALSPDGTKIAFVKILNSKFYLGTMNVDGSDEMLLKTGYIIEAPSWAPLGNNIIVAIQEGKKARRQIYSISSKTGHSYAIPNFSGNIVQADWFINDTDTILQTSYHE